MASSSKSLVGARLRETSTTQLFELGTSTYDDKGSRWEYVQAAGVINIYDYVKVDDDFQAAAGTTTLLPATQPARVGCAQVAFADNDYGWVVRSGQHTGNFAASCAADVKIYTTATAGVVDDAATTLINGLKLITTITSAASAPAFASCDMTTVAA